MYHILLLWLKCLGVMPWWRHWWLSTLIAVWQFSRALLLAIAWATIATINLASAVADACACCSVAPPETKIPHWGKGRVLVSFAPIVLLSCLEQGGTNQRQPWRKVFSFIIVIVDSSLFLLSSLLLSFGNNTLLPLFWQGPGQFMWQSAGVEEAMMKGCASWLCGWLCAPVFLLGLHAEALQNILAIKCKVGIAGKVFSRQTNLLNLIISLMVMGTHECLLFNKLPWTLVTLSNLVFLQCLIVENVGMLFLPIVLCHHSMQLVASMSWVKDPCCAFLLLALKQRLSLP